MKLRIKGNSMRLRISQSEMKKLMEDGRIAETVAFGPEPEAQLTYALEHADGADGVEVLYRERTVSVVVATSVATSWAAGDEVGIYGSVATSLGTLDVMVEKDFACLDGNDPQDADAFPNPSAVAC